MNNFAHWVFERHQQRLDQVSHIDSARSMTFAELQDQSQRLAASLRSHGLVAGDFAIIAQPTSCDFVVAFFACIQMGIVPVPIDENATHDFVTRLQQRLHAKIILGTKYAAIADNLSNVAFSEYYQYAKDQLCLLLCTSGSTGDPKLVCHRHEILYQLVNLAERSGYGIEQTSTLMCASKLSFGYSVSNNCIVAPGIGCQAVLYDQPLTPQQTATLVNVHKVTHLFAFPLVYNQLNDKAKVELGSHLTCCVVSTEPCPKITIDRFQQKYNRPLLNGIGWSELFWMATANTPNQNRPYSIGKPLPGLATRIVDEQGNDCEVGQPGMLLVDSGSTAIGYFDKLAANTATFDQGWMKTGDIVAQDANGFYWFVNRQGQYVKINSQWVSSQDIENTLLDTDQFKECTVVFDRNANDTLEAVAYAVPISNDVNPVRLRSDLLTRFKSHLVPKRIYLMPCLPRNARNKRVIDPDQLKRAYHDSLSQH